MPLAGARDNLPPPSVFQARAKRVVDNHREGLTVFAPLVLAISIAHISNHWTVLGAELFLCSRVAHAVVYLAAVPLIRPLVWSVGLVGTVMILFAALGI